MLVRDTDQAIEDIPHWGYLCGVTTPVWISPLWQVCLTSSGAMSQVANADFFLKTLPLFDAGDDVGMVLSPQSFYNVDTNQDIFNHGNIQFWEYAQHGYDAIGFISCTGKPLWPPS